MTRIIPVFLPQHECPFRCVFCNQGVTVGEVASLGTDELKLIIEKSLKSIPQGEGAQVAFYGGSFTVLPTSEQEKYLKTAHDYIQREEVSSIRVSTRPDYISEKAVRLLLKYGVNTVELGVQIMDDNILAKIKRGHTSEDVVNAVEILKRKKIKTGIQLMAGLPGENTRIRENAWQRALSLEPDYMRIHPTLVMKGSELADMYSAGAYEPLALEKAVSICADMFADATRAGIKVIRLGIQSSVSLQASEAVLGGPWHPSFGQMVKSLVYYRLVETALEKLGMTRGRVEITVPPKEISNLTGLNKSNKIKLENVHPKIEFDFKTDRDIPANRIKCANGTISLSLGLEDLG